MLKNSNPDPKPQCVQTDVMQSAMATDYRIGNIIQYNNDNKSTGTITALIADFVSGLDYCQIDYRANKKHWLINIKPIKLTNEWLLKFGFVKSKENEWYHLLDFQIEIVVDENNEFVFCVVEGIVLKHIKYVHQLQNLHYCLKQTELAVV